MQTLLMRALHLFRPWPCSGRSAGTFCGSAPSWWQRGWPRQRVGSMAEAELLAPLAEVLMPHLPIAELFRSFPSPKGWSGHYLEPDLAAYGVLKDVSAGLFVEYDGYWRHGEREGLKMDQKKNEALLMYAPKGSYVIRISHTISRPLQENVLWVKAATWRSGCPKQSSKIYQHILRQALTALTGSLHHAMEEHLWSRADERIVVPSAALLHFIYAAKAIGNASTMDEISLFLETEGFCKRDIDMMLRKVPWHRMSIERKLRPALQWLLNLGLTKGQVAKALGCYPQFLGLSIELNLKPTVQWLLNFGLTKAHIAKAVARHPGFLGLSINRNLEPTLQFFLELGLTKTQVAKIIATCPHILSLSTEQNLKATVQWMSGFGLAKSQIAKAVAAFPQILSLNIELNLKPTVQWLLKLGLTKSQVAKAMATFPHIMGYSVEQNLKPTVQFFLGLGLAKDQVAKAVATSPQILSLSPKKKLNCTVQWMLDLGLTKGQIATVVARHPPILWYSTEKNLGPKMLLLNDFFAAKGAREMVAKWPQLLGYSYHRLTTRLKILARQGETHKLTSVMPLTEEAFQRRFLNGAKKMSEGFPRVVGRALAKDPSSSTM